MEAGYHPPVEEYLETIHALAEEGVAVIAARIAERLGRSAPSVSQMLDRLTDEGYLERKGRAVVLTPRGTSLATTVVRRHRLAERLLTDVIGLEWHKVHEEAGRWEHVISADVEARLVALLGDPATCPHGNPIPGSKHDSRLEAISLFEIDPGASVRLERISEALEVDVDALRLLDEHRFIPGERAEVEAVTPEGGLRLRVGVDRFEIGCDLAAQLFVTVD